MVNVKDFVYKDRREVEKEEVYFKRQAEEKRSLIEEMQQIAKETQKMKDKTEQGIDEFIKNWRERSEE